MSFASVTAILIRAAASLVHRARLRADRRKLDAMPDHLLKDMGIQRCAIGYVVSRDQRH
jgi:uncharacterized protein YjiS (DUF1127 family)